MRLESCEAADWSAEAAKQQHTTNKKSWIDARTVCDAYSDKSHNGQGEDRK